MNQTQPPPSGPSINTTSDNDHQSASEKPFRWHLWYILATWFGSGDLRPAPGTWGTIASLPLMLAVGWLITYLEFEAFSSHAFISLAAILFITGLWSTKHYTRKIPADGPDPKTIVIDETTGLAVTFAFVAEPLPTDLAAWGWIAAAVILFRFFDILKPCPICTIDQKCKGAWGVMADDILAGLAAGMVILFLQTFDGALL